MPAAFLANCKKGPDLGIVGKASQYDRARQDHTRGSAEVPVLDDTHCHVHVSCSCFPAAAGELRIQAGGGMEHGAEVLVLVHQSEHLWPFMATDEAEAALGVTLGNEAADTGSSSYHYSFRFALRQVNLETILQ